jgi:class 3 adenylate cyclase
MGLAQDLQNECGVIFRSRWNVRQGTTVPEPEDVKLGNEGVELAATVLYADLVASTALVDAASATFAAEVYKTYLLCSSKIIRSEGGAITAFDGDRVMGIFIGGSKNTTAVRCALKINYAVQFFVNPALKSMYTSSPYVVRQVVGVDTSKLTAARTGVRGANDLVWVGRAANYAAKLSGLDEPGYSTYITKTVYDGMHDDVKVSGDGRHIWESRTWTTMNQMSIYRSSWWWTVT